MFKADCANTPGFIMSAGKAMTFPEFWKVNGKWEKVLIGAFKACLASGEYVRTRNALLILNRLIKVHRQLFCSSDMINLDYSRDY